VSAGQADDTIVAVATAQGRGALAIVRLSGPGAHDLARTALRPWPASARRATRVRVYDTSGALLDECVAVYYRSPASFTGEDAVEITCHGGALASATIAASLVARGARPAEPGEFTRRAVLNGKLDLLQAEAIGDLVDAASRPAQRVALAQLDGGLSRRVEQLRQDILGLEALAAYDIDFPEEDDGPIPAARILGAAADVIDALDRLIATAGTGEVVREGAVVVIAGMPNAGKSSLFNALLGRRRAIVTEVPGTTRDALEAVIEAEGWPVRLVDTAGLRDATEFVERLGIEMSREYLERAAAVIVCGDSRASLAATRSVVQELTAAPLVLVHTKADLLEGTERAAAASEALPVSAESGEGLSGLLGAIATALRASKGSLALDAPVITRERHRFAIEKARDELREFHSAFASRAVPAVVAAVHLREATRNLEELIGAVEVEDVLERVFRTFCVGK
jgi:tRNA modification GTPase